MLKNMPALRSPELLASWNRGEDAALWVIDQKRLGILTLDFITPVVDSPVKFGEIAAANSLSDVYAMGGRPLVALNVVCFPTASEPLSVLQEILLGGANKVIEAGAMLAGGHSVQDEEPKYGLVVFGEVESGGVWKVGGAKAGDALILTKPLGTGIAVTAIKAGLFSEEYAAAAAESMAKLNAVPPLLSDEMKTAVTSCTDVTGFGLAGHALDMPSEGVSVEIDTEALPLLPGIGAMAEMGLIPAGTYANREYSGAKVFNFSALGQFAEDIAFDPQTSGGLLISVPEKLAGRLLEELRGGFSAAEKIGRFTEGDMTLKLI